MSGRVFYKISRRFVKDDAQRKIGRQAGTQQVVDDNGDVFCRWIQFSKSHSIQVEVAMIESVEHLCLDDVRQHLRVDHVACVRIRKTGHLHNQFIIMAVIVGKVAFAEDLGIFCIIPGGIMQAVGGVKMFLSTNGDLVCHVLGVFVVGKTQRV